MRSKDSPSSNLAVVGPGISRSFGAACPVAAHQRASIVERRKLHTSSLEQSVKTASTSELKDGEHCLVVGGTHAGKNGTVTDIKTSKTGHVTITVVQANGERFKTLAKNVARKRSEG
jgi:ribosomal protein S4E